MVVIGASLGGLQAIRKILGNLPADYQHPIVIIQHRHRTSQGRTLALALERSTALKVGDAVDKQKIEPGCVILAPADYHLLIDRGRVALSIDEPVLYSRPSIDVAFDSAARSYGPRAVAVVLTGANSDGAEGAATIRSRGGIVIVQDPEEAESDAMPRAAISAVPDARVMKLSEIGKFLATDLSGVAA